MNNIVTFKSGELTIPEFIGGESGVGISDIQWTDDYRLVIILDNGTFYKSEPLKGIQGEKGDTGEAGRSIDTVSINTAGIITFTFSDGTVYYSPAIKGDNGKSAYDLAVEGGYEGDLADWLQSLHGVGIDSIIYKETDQCHNKVYTINYTDGTTSEFSVHEGLDGKSAYQLAVEAGYTGTIEEWLNSIKGRGIESFTLTATEGLSNTYTMTYTDGTTFDIAINNGRGIASITLNRIDGENNKIYSILYNDGTTTEFTVHDGIDGKSAFQYAVDGGYDGTEEEFEQFLSDIMSATGRAEEAAQQAEESAAEAQQSAEQAEESAGLAQQSAEQAEESAQRAEEAKEFVEDAISDHGIVYFTISDETDIDYEIGHLLRHQSDNLDSMEFKLSEDGNNLILNIHTDDN